MPAGLNPDSLTDGDVPAAFTADDFDWMGGNLTMTVSNADIYDAVDITTLHEGDTVVYDGKPIVVKSVKENNDCIDVNGGLDEGSASFKAHEGGTYRAITFNYHSIYTELGKVQVALADNFAIVDCGINPDDPSDTIKTNQKLYIENLKDDRREFSPLNTIVSVEKGQITKITRRWIP